MESSFGQDRKIPFMISHICLLIRNTKDFKYNGSNAEKKIPTIQAKEIFHVYIFSFSSIFLFVNL